MNSSTLDTRITTLATDIKRGPGIFVQPSEHFESCWTEVKALGAVFKAIRYPTRAEKQNAWDRFQEAVQCLKKAQDQHFRERRDQFQQREEQSARLMREILGLGEDALPPDMISGVFMAMVELPFQAVEDAGRAMLGFSPLDHAKEDLKRRSEKLRQAFAQLKAESKKLLRDHQDQVWRRLHEIQDKLDDEWTAYKQARQQHWEAGQRQYEARQAKQAAWEARQATWRENQRAYIDRQWSALAKQEAYLDKKQDELRALEDKRDSAWSDDFRDKVEGWIDECRSKIEEVEASIRDLKSKIAEAEARLNE